VAAGHKQGMSLETWHLSGGPVGSLARWSATSNVEVVQMKSVVGHFIRGAECPRRQMFWWGGGYCVDTWHHCRWGWSAWLARAGLKSQSTSECHCLCRTCTRKTTGRRW